MSANLLDAVSTTDAAGNVHVAWREGADLLYRKLDGRGNTLVRTVRTGFGPMSPIGYGWRHLTIAAAPDGTVALAWYFPGTDPGIYVAALDSGGRVASAPVRLREGSWAYLSSAFDASGAWHLTARESTFPDSSAPSNRVFYGRFTRNATGFTPVSAWVPVADLVGQGRAVHPNMVVQPDRTAHVTWFDNRRFPVSGRYDVYYTRIGAGGVPTVSALRVSDVAGGFPIVDDTQQRSKAPAIDVDDAGRATMAWISGTDVYVAGVTAGGTVSPMGTKVDLGANASGSKLFGIQAHLEPDGSTSLLLPVGSDSSSTLVQAAVDAGGATKLPPVALPLGSGSWRYPSLTTAGGEQRIVVARVTSGPTAGLYVTSTAALGDPVDRPDLLVDDAHSTDSSSPSPPREGTTVTMTVQVANAGWVASPATTARFTYGATQLAEVPVPALAVEQTATVSASWTVPAGLPVTPAAITVRVDPANAITGTAEANNAVDHLVAVRLRPNGVGVTALGWDETADPTRKGNLGVLGFSATLTGTVTGGGAFSRTVTAPAVSNLAWFGEVPPGTYTLTGTLTGYGGPAAVPVTEREQGLTATTAADGSYTLPELAAGVHHLAFTRDGYGRVQEVPAPVTVGSTTVVNQGLSPTTVAYVDVTVTNGAGTGLPAATVELLPAAGGAPVAGCTEHLRSLDISLNGNPFYVELMKTAVSDDIGGPYVVQQIPVLTSNTASEATNVRVDAVRVYDRLTGTTFFQQRGGGLFYPHTATADANAKGYTFGAGVDWANVVVTIDVRVGRAVPGTGGAGGWASSPVLACWRSDVQRITWVPSANALTIAARLG